MSDSVTPAKIFISYARGDDPQFVRTLHHDLLTRSRAEGNRPLRFFYDKLDMPSRGKSFLLEIRDFIGDPDTERLLLVVGPRALESPYVQAEWRAALERCVTVVPLLRIGRAQHAEPHNPRRIDEEDYASIPTEVQETRVHAIDFRTHRGALSGRPYEEAFEELWRVLADPVTIGDLAPGVPDLPGNFIPRTEYLRALNRILLTDADDPVTVHGEHRFAVLTGMGGVGKSVLAASFCRACKTRRSFKDGIAWVRMGQRPQLPAELTDLFGSARMVAGARRASVGLRDLSCLIVLDDVTDPAHVARFTNALGESGRLLITTRDAAVATSLNAQRCDVELLTESQSLELLADWTGCAVTDLPAPALAALSECGRLPLAIAMIGAMMKGKPPDRWRYVLKDLQGANLDEIRHRFPNYDHPDLLRALEVGVNALEGFGRDRRGTTWEHKVRARQRYLELAIFAGNTPIPPAALHLYWTPTGVTESVAARLCDLFVDRNLARRDAMQRIVLHDLQHDYLIAEQRDHLKRLNARFIDAHRPEGGWRNAVDDGYLFAHLADHLHDAGLTQELNGLVDREWMENRFAATGSHRGFADDVNVVLENLAEGGCGEDLVPLTRAVLVLGTIAELAAQVPPKFIGALALTGQVDKAIHNATLIAEERSRVFALSEVAGVLIEQGGTHTALSLVQQCLREVEGTSDHELEILAVGWAARCLAELGRVEPALATAKRALSLLGNKTQKFMRVLENVSRAFLHARRLPDARRLARRFFKGAQGHRSDLLGDAAALLVEVGENKGFAEAIASLRQRIKFDHQEAQAALLVAERLFLAGRQAEGTELAESVASSIDNDVGDWRKYGWRKQVVLVSAAAATFGRLGHARKAEAFAKRALAALRRLTPDEAFTVLYHVTTMRLAIGQKALSARLARRALKAVSQRDRLDGVATVAELLNEAGCRDEAQGLLNSELAAAFVIPNPWASRDSAGILGETLVRVGRVDDGVAQLRGLSDRYGARGRAQIRLAGALAEVGAFDAAESVALTADQLYRSDALDRVAIALAWHGLGERAHRVAMAIERDWTRALTLCHIAKVEDASAVLEASRQAEAAANPAALGLLAERLATQESSAAGRKVARRALEITTHLKGHAFVSVLGDLSRAFLTVGDPASVRRADALLRDVDDREYRSEGRLRLALALAERGQLRRARLIVKQELPRVEQLKGRDVPRATMLATIALILFHVGTGNEAVRRARNALVALNQTGSSWNSDYDKHLARARAIHVLAITEQLDAAYAAGELTFGEFVQACTENGKGGVPRIRALLDEARRLAAGVPKAHALAYVASAFDRAGMHDAARPLLVEALRFSYHGARSSVFAVMEISADLIAAFDSGETLAQLCNVISEIESWWVTSEVGR